MLYRGFTGAVALLIVLTGCQSAVVESDHTAQPAPPPPTADAIPTGTVMDLRLDETLSTERSRVGDRFSMTVTKPLVAQNGQTIVPAGAVVSGEVTGLKEARRIGDQAAIRLHFERITIEDQSHPFDAKILEADVRTRSDARTGEGAVIGGAAGAALGAIIGGDLAATLVGGALGAGAGTIISLGLGDTDAELPAGSIVTVQTSQRTSLR